ncbi:Protein DAMAGED DNA-BINDING 2 [Cardamine amara subsp. amara]|uniref:WD repeat-containing protein 76 n=1 Tax=Cardamine amara subsp. amara TaxID=228776 RepID=A0ABD1AFI1_CARAN
MATEYERKRLENIRRNDEMMAALKVHAKASLLSAATAAKRSRRDDSKSFKKKQKTKPETPTVIRKSLRTRGLNPDSGGLPDGFSDNPKRTRIQNTPSPQKQSPRLLAPLPIDSAYEGEGSYTQLLDTLLCIEKKSCRGSLIKEEIGSVKKSNRNLSKKGKKSNRSYVKEEFDNPVKLEKIESEDGFDQDLLSLEPQNVARVVPGRIFAVKFLPCENVKMIAAGDKFGNVGFWNLDCENEEDDDGIYLFTPHSAPVSSIVFQQNSFSRVISSSYDGLIRLMDVEKLVFDLVYSTDEAIFSLSQRPSDEQCLYFGEGDGMFNIWDLRAGKSNFHWDLHERRINSIDFNPQNPHVMATSSTDGTAYLWDLRSMGANKPKTLATVNHSKAVHSAYFSPSGLSLATTSYDNYIGILSGANFEDTCMIYHNNITNRWISTFRGVWGWDDSYIYVANLSKKIDLINPKLKRTVMELHDPLMKAIPCRIHCHPFTVGTLAGSTAGGQVYVWTAR